MANFFRIKILVFILISCVLLTKFTNSTPLYSSSSLVNYLANDQTKLSINNEHQNKFLGNGEANKNLEKSGLKSDDDDEEDDKDDKKDDKKDDDDKDDKKEEKEDKKDDSDKDDKKDDKDGKKEDKDDKKDDADKDDKKDDKNETDEKKPDEKPKKIDEKLDDNQKKKPKAEPVNFDDSSQEKDSHSNPDTEEEGPSESESDEDDKNEEKEPLKGKLDKKLLIILASGFRYDYVHIQKLEAIKDILKSGTTAKVKPAFPSNSYPNYYALVTGLNPAKNGFIDDEMYDTKYKEEFPGKGHNHKHWWNKVEPLWITAMNNKLKIGTFWWKGACGITIKSRTPKPPSCVPYKEKVSTSEVSKQLEGIVEDFSKNKLDLALLSYEEIEKVGSKFGPESHKLRKAVRNFDKILDDVLKNIDDKKLKDKVNLVVVSDHGMISIGEKIDLEKFIDFNDIDKFINTGTFAMILPEENKEDYIFNLLRNAKIEGLNVYKKPDFPPKFKFEKGETDELILPIVLTTDKGYYIGEPSVDKNEEDGNDKDDEPKKGNHGYHPMHVKEMNAAMFATGPDFEKNHVVPTIDQVDLYNVFCKILKIKPLKNDGNKDIVDDFLHGSSSEEHQDDDDNDDDKDSGDVEDGYAPEKKKNDNLPVYKSRWALRGNSNSISLHLSLKFLILIITLIIFT